VNRVMHLRVPDKAGSFFAICAIISFSGTLFHEVSKFRLPEAAPPPHLMVPGTETLTLISVAEQWPLTAESSLADFVLASSTLLSTRQNLPTR
jgi:hypothetical protein